MSKSVLIVDDSLVSRLMIKEIISSKYPDWEIVQAKNADDAITQSSGKSFDLITLDLNMPGRTGLEVAPELLALHPDVRIALLTANIQNAVKEKAQELGLEFLTKPIIPPSVIEFIEG
ncbi:MAG: response regulator [Gammaproteobacteria bacterium]|nr:response regulator [Gammaproteobacteria bacterium]